MTTAEEHKSGGIGKDLVVYVCLLALAGLQFVIAYQNIDASQMFWRMLTVACVEAGLAVLFFMHLWTKSGLSVVCPHLYGFCPAGDAIWVDRQPSGCWSAPRHFQDDFRKGTAGTGKSDVKLQAKKRIRVEKRSCLLVLRWWHWSCSPPRSRPFSQSCALCYTQAASAGARMIQALRSGILILIVPPTLCRWA
jgi:hypothetical protein